MFGGQKNAFGGFGTTGTFGNTGTTSAFGGTSTGLFGSSTANTGSIFGNTAPAAGTLFGNTATSTATTSSGGFSFGGNTGTTSIFGANQNNNNAAATGLFGQTAPSTSAGFGGFGTAKPTGSLFGSTAPTQSTSLFGNTTTTPSTTFFGATSQVPVGTTIKFNPVSGNDTMMKNNQQVSINTKHQCITVMKEYESKSIEELRMEDYAENRKGPQPGASAGGLFATPASTGGLFGSTAPTKPLFGSTTTSSGGLFGTQTTATPSLFGNTAASTGIFGAKPTSTATFAMPAPTTTNAFSFGSQPSSTGGLFGQQQAQKPLFGQPTTTAGGGLFGATPTSSFGTFGAKPTTQSSGLFAQPSAASTNAFSFNTPQAPMSNLFGSKPATSAPFGTTPNLFGGTSTSTFGSTAPTGTGLFGNTSLSQPTTTKPFSFNLGTNPTGTAPQAGGGIFGNTQPGGLFPSTSGTGAKPFSFNTTTAGGLSTGGSLFGGTANSNAFGGGNLFGAPAPTATMAGSAFGAPGAAMTTTVPANHTIATASPFGGTDADVHQILMLVNTYPYGNSPLFKNLPKSSDPSAREALLKPTSVSAQKALMSSQATGMKVNARSGQKVKPTPLLTMTNAKPQIFDGFEDEELTWLKSLSYTPRSSVKKLVLPKRGATGRLRTRDSPDVSVESVVNGDSPSLESMTHLPTPAKMVDFTLDESHADVSVAEDKENGRSLRSPSPSLTPVAVRRRLPLSSRGSETNLRRSEEDVGPVVSTSLSVNEALQNGDVSLNGTTILDDSCPSVPDPLPAATAPPHPAGIQLTRDEYYTIPSMEELAQMTNGNGKCVVDNLTIGRAGYGSVFFPGETDVTGLNLDEIIFFRRHEIQVYVDEENKPELGQGLNKPAEVTLDCVYPNDKTTREPITDPERLTRMGFSSRLERSCIKKGTKFLEYRPETGSWVFSVKHFSKYAFDDSDEDDDNTQRQPPNKQPLKTVANMPTVTTVTMANPSTVTTTMTTTISSASLFGGGDAPVGLGGVDASVSRIDSSTIGLGGLPPMSDEEMNNENSDVLTPTQAAYVGPDAARVQLMKASFFGAVDDDTMEDETRGRMSPMIAPSPLLSRLRKAPVTGPLSASSPAKVLRLTDSPLAFPSPVTLRAEDDDSYLDSPILENHPILPSGLTETLSDRVAAGVRRIYPLVPEEESLTYNRQDLIMDAAFFMGRSFRVGWGPAWTLVHAASSDSPAAAPFSVTVGALRVADHVTAENGSVVSSVEKALDVQLKHSEMTSKIMLDSCPEFKPKEGIELIHGHADLVANELENSHRDDVDSVTHALRIWRLLVALYGCLPETLSHTDERGTYLYHIARRSTFSSWLATHASGSSEALDSSSGKDVSRVLTLLLANRVAEALEEAQRQGDHRMVLLVSQIGGNGLTKSMIRQQVADWAANGSDAFFQIDRLKIFALVSGCVPLQTSTSLINPCEEADWITALALHLWYVCPSTSGVSDAIALYSAAFEGPTPYAAPPLPPYLARRRDSVYDDEALGAFDTCFLLMRLFQDKSACKLERVLATATHTPLPLDSRVSWFLAQALRSLSYTHLSTTSRAQLNLDFASLLESLGLWHWSVFVLQHNPDSRSRNHAVRQMLQRYLPLDEDRRLETFLTENLKIPQLWIHEAKALRADFERERDLQAYHLLKSEAWNACHDVIVKYLAARAIVNGRYDKVFEMLSELNVPDRSSSIYDWPVGGQIFFDFIWLRKNLDEGGNFLSEAELYGPKIASLCNRISNLKCSNSYDRLAQVEIARHCSRYLKSLLRRRREAGRGFNGGSCGVSAIASILPSFESLPLPENHAINELNELTRQFLLQLA